MSVQELLDFYGSDNKAALNLGITVQAVRKWKANNVIPRWSQCAIAYISKRKLKVDPE